MNRYRLVGRWTGCFTVILSTLFFVGCQGLGGGKGSVALTNSSLDFGAVPVGSTKNIQDTLTNGTASSVTISTIQGVDGTLQVTGISLPLVVAAGQSSSFNVQFKPNAPGTTSLTLSYLGMADRVWHLSKS